MKTFWPQLQEALMREPLVLLVVVKALGSTPREVGAMQYRTANGGGSGSVGGGRMEALALEAARKTLADGETRMVDADLQGRPGALRDGICGGRMTLWVGRLEWARDGHWVREIAGNPGRAFTLSFRRDDVDFAANSSGKEADGIARIQVVPPPILLIVGAGHIGRAVARLADWTGFVVAVQDDRKEWLETTAFPEGTMLGGGLASHLEMVESWVGRRLVVLVTRGFPQDQAVLPRVAAVEALDYLGVLGSRVRWKALETDCQEKGIVLPSEPVLHAPVGLKIGAETPEEIAVSIVGEMVRCIRL